ncbi:MAG: hypothetical protein RML72_02945 [Bacteroidia bacterium]|nr:hypothetical protein [Bacteroidia bacterium]MDW8157818.1 hypothetical protein [Bacteroidia bacterium]
MIKKYIFLLIILFFSLGCKESKEDATKSRASASNPNFPVAQSKPQPIYDRQINDWARYLAGLPPLPGSQLDSIDYRMEAKKHQEFFEKAWAWKEKKLLQPLAEWAKVELAAEQQRAKTVFYPFSGPDFMTIHALYPNAERYILMGLENEGRIPPLEQIRRRELAATLENLRISLNDILNYSFFKTNDMRAELNRFQIRGTLPILLAFIARRGNTVLEVEHVQLSANGEIKLGNPNANQQPEDSTVTGVQILFRASEDAPVQKIIYFSANINNTYIKKLKGMVPYIQSLEPAYTYLKSASYLMHADHFSIIRDLILKVSRSLLQDDSGIALRFFDRQVWDLTFYGTYTAPIPLFAARYQPELRKIYAQKEGVKPLTFGIGYQFREGTSNLMLARKKIAQ